MTNLELSLSDLKSKAQVARTDIRDVVSLRAIAIPEDGASFMVARTLYIWRKGDTTPDNGRTCIALETSAAGRFQVPKILFPFQGR